MDGDENSVDPVINTFAGFKFFSEEECGDPLYLNCNFVFLTRDDGSGTFPPGDPQTAEIISDIINKMNNRWAGITDIDDCSPDWDYPYDSNVRVNVNTHYIANTAAWDYHAQAEALGDTYNKHSFCPNEVDAPNSTWPALKGVIKSFNAEHPEAINFFFVENGQRLLSDGTDPYLSPQNDVEIFSGCSRRAAPYSSSQEQFIIMANFYTAYFMRINYGGVLYPDAGVPNQTLAQWHLDGMPIIANHELGHSIMNQSHTEGCDNLMSSSFSMSKKYLTPNQLEILHLTLMATNHHNYVSCENISENTCDVRITSNATINIPMSVYGDIIIESGATLTISSEVYLSEESSINLEENAKLIVNGGLLTNGCGQTWKGIRVTGGNEDFDVKLNNATIENTSGAAVSMFPPLPWPEMQNHGNGILHADNTVFNNVRRMAELIAFTPSLNSSYIRNCTQNGGKWGITNWNCLFVEVADSKFNDIADECIVINGGSVNINHNDFYSGKNDVLIVNVSQGVGSAIEGNRFYGNETGVRALGAGMYKNTIQGNLFTSPFGVWLEGDNAYDIDQNSFLSTFGTISFNNGNHSNKVSSNEFDYSFLSVFAQGANNAFNFYENCFNSLYADVYLDGSVSPVVSNGNKPANNCFTHQGNISSPFLDITGNPSSFMYVEPLVLNDYECLKAVKAHPNVNTERIGDGEDACNNAGAEMLVPPQEESMCNPERTASATLDAISSLSAAIAMLPQGTIQEQEYTQCMSMLRRQLFELYVLDGQYEAARYVYAGESTDDAAVAVFSSFLLEGDLNTAKVYLDQTMRPGEAFEDFKEVQYINLARLLSWPFYQASEVELERLRSIAENSHPYAAYAKSLYYVFTEEILASVLPLDLQATVAPRSNESLEQPDFKTFRVFPNPFRSQLTIHLPRSNDAEYHIEVVAFSGKVIHENVSVSGDIELDTSLWPPGLYVVKAKDNLGNLFQEKVVLTR